MKIERCVSNVFFFFFRYQCGCKICFKYRNYTLTGMKDSIEHMGNMSEQKRKKKSTKWILKIATSMRKVKKINAQQILEFIFSFFFDNPPLSRSLSHSLLSSCLRAPFLPQIPAISRPPNVDSFC